MLDRYSVFDNQRTSENSQRPLDSADVGAMVWVPEFSDSALRYAEFLRQCGIGDALLTYSRVERDLGSGDGFEADGFVSLAYWAGKRQFLTKTIVAAECRNKSIFGHVQCLFPCGSAGIGSRHIWE